MSRRRHCVVVTTKHGPVRVQAHGDLTARDIEAIEAVADALHANKVDPLSVCPGCGCYRDRCACDLREQEGSGGDAILDRGAP